MLTEKYDFRITDQMTIPLRPHWIANDSYREKCKMLVLNRSKGEIHKVDFSKVTDYIKEGDVICFNDSTIINYMFICKTRRNRLIKIVLEGFLLNNRVIISGLLKERLNANDVFYLVDNPEISIKVEQKFSEESQYRAVVENHDALICYLASHGERLDEYVDSSLFYKYPDAYRSVFSKKYGSLDVDKGNFSITTYYPPEPPLKHLLNPFRKNDIPQAPEFTIGMLIASARAGRWLYELIHAWGLLSVLHHHGAHNVYYVKCTRTIKRHVKAAGFVHVKKLLAHKFDPFPAVTLREFC